MENRKMKTDAIIFDLDGTLLDTVDDLLDSVNYALDFYGFPLQDKEIVRLSVGNGITKLMERTSPKGADIGLLIKKFKEYYLDIKTSKTRPYDGIIELLEGLKAKGIKVGILSNKFDRGCKMHAELFFKGLYDYAQGEDSLNGILPKPNTEGLYKVIEILNAKNPVFAGDSEVDIKTAKNGNIPCISVLWGLKTEEFLKKEGGEIFVKSPLEILSMV